MFVTRECACLLWCFLRKDTFYRTHRYKKKHEEKLRIPYTVYALMILIYCFISKPAYVRMGPFLLLPAFSLSASPPPSLSTPRLSFFGSFFFFWGWGTLLRTTFRFGLFGVSIFDGGHCGAQTFLHGHFSERTFR